ncbi:tetratricopeptide repeat protein [bacterium]|nr:tetratricopeptide repeat protein [bacterium]
MKIFQPFILIIFFSVYSLHAQEVNLTKFFRFFINANYDSSRAFIEKELLKDPDNLVLHLYLGRVFLVQKKYSLAISSFKNALQHNKSDAAIYNYIGKAYEEQGMLAEAAHAYTSSIKLDSSLYAQLKLGSIFFKQNNYNACTAVLTKLISRDSTNLYAYYLLGRSFLKSDKNDSAIVFCSKAVQLDSTYYPGLLNLGIAFFNSRLYKNAVKSLNKAVIISPESHEARYYLGYAYIKLDQRADALTQLEFCANSNSRFKQKALIALIEFYRKIGLNKECIRTAKKYLELNTKNYLTTVYFHLGCALSEEQNFSEADSAFQKSLACSNLPLIKGIYFYRGLNSHKQQEYIKAINYYKKAVTLNPDDPYTYYNLAIVYDEFYKDKKPAIKYYQKFLDYCKNKDDNSVLVQAAINRIKSLKQKLYFKK